MSKKIVDEAFFQSLELLDIYLKDNVAGSFGGNHRSKSYGSSSEFADYREYIPGDDIRRIDWNIFSRFEKLFLKLYLDERQMHIKIYVDASKSMDYGENSKSFYSLRLAVTFAYLAIKAMDKVSIYALKGNKCEKIVEGVVGKESFYNSIHAINNVVFEGDSTISDAIMNSTSVGYGDGMSIIISDFLTRNDYKEAISYLRSKHRDVCCIQVLTDEEINPRSTGKNIYYDSENRSRFYKKNVTKDIMKAYKEALDYIQKDISHFCVTRDARYLFVSTSETIDQVILNNAIKKEILK